MSVQFVPQHNLQALADAALLLAMKMKSPQVPVALNIVDGQQNRLDELFVSINQKFFVFNIINIFIGLGTFYCKQVRLGSFNSNAF